MSTDHFGPPSTYLLTNALARAERHHAKAAKSLRDRHRIHWFLWRSAILVAWVTNERTALLLRGPRTVPLVRYRHFTLWLAKQIGNLSNAGIAAFLGVDATTVRDACLGVEGEFETNSLYQQLLNDVTLADAELDVRFA